MEVGDVLTRIVVRGQLNVGQAAFRFTKTFKCSAGLTVNVAGPWLVGRSRAGRSRRTTVKLIGKIYQKLIDGQGPLAQGGRCCRYRRESPANPMDKAG
jgi:hypothetical protein